MHRFTKTGTNEIDGFFRQARRESAAVLRYGKILQRSLAEKVAISCLGFIETVYQCRVTLKTTVYRAAIGVHG